MCANNIRAYETYMYVTFNANVKNTVELKPQFETSNLFQVVKHSTRTERRHRGVRVSSRTSREQHVNQAWGCLYVYNSHRMWSTEFRATYTKSFTRDR